VKGQKIRGFRAKIILFILRLGFFLLWGIEFGNFGFLKSSNPKKGPKRGFLGEFRWGGPNRHPGNPGFFAVVYSGLILNNKKKKKTKNNQNKKISHFGQKKQADPRFQKKNLKLGDWEINSPLTKVVWAWLFPQIFFGGATPKSGLVKKKKNHPGQLKGGAPWLFLLSFFLM